MTENIEQVSIKAVELETRFEKGDNDALSSVIATTPWQQRLDLAKQMESINDIRRQSDPSLPKFGLTVKIDAQGREHVWAISTCVPDRSGVGEKYDWKPVYKNPAADLMERLDIDHNGYLTAAEVKAGVRPDRLFEPAPKDQKEAQERLEGRLANRISSMHSAVSEMNDDGWFTASKGVSMTDIELFVQAAIDNRLKKK